MKEIIEARYNVLYVQNGTEETLKLNPECEIILVYTDGKDYIPNKSKGGFDIQSKLNETRFFATPYMMDELIQGLQKIRMNLKSFENMSAVVNDIASSLMEKK